jgi:polysaccharide deacetylase 2 family uncharacterized protein YibQ
VSPIGSAIGARGWVFAGIAVFLIGLGLGLGSTAFRADPPIPAAADPAGPPPDYSATDRRALDRLMAAALDQPVYRAPPFHPETDLAPRGPAASRRPAPAAQAPSPAGEPPGPAPRPAALAAPPPVSPKAGPAPSPSPRPQDDASLPWRRYAVAVDPPDGRPMIAIVIDDAGVDRLHTQQAIRMHGPLTISFLPYALDLPEQSRAAHAAGHELLVHVPMEPFGAYNDPGPNVLMVGQSHAELLHRLVRDLDSFQGYVGINNHMGSRFTSQAEGMSTVASELRHRGLLFLDSRTTAQSVAFQVAVEHGVPSVVRDVFLDNEDKAAEVERRLAEVEQIARRQGHAIAIGHPREVTLTVLAPWLAAVGERGFRLVPVSAVVMSRFMLAGEVGHRP